VKRREFITLIGGVAGWLAVRAPRVGGDGRLIDKQFNSARAFDCSQGYHRLWPRDCRD
jgi:hypothetical protein